LVYIFSVGLQDLSIEITERDPADQPGGIPYKLLAEACVPGINITDIGAIFEEHRICRSLNLWQQTSEVSLSFRYSVMKLQISSVSFLGYLQASSE